MGWRAEGPRRVSVLFEGQHDEMFVEETLLSFVDGKTQFSTPRFDAKNGAAGPQQYPLNNLRVGRFFVRFERGVYVPNVWLRKCYRLDGWMERE